MSKKLIAFIGFAKSGKDFASDYIIDNPNEFKNLKFKRIAFADKLKEVYCEEHNITREELEINKPAHRNGLIEMGEGKRKISPTYWIDLIKEDVLSSEDNIIITDLRRITEVDFLINLKNDGWDVKIVYVIRPKANKGIFEADKDTALTILYTQFHELQDVIITNNGTIEEYFKKLKWIL